MNEESPLNCPLCFCHLVPFEAAKVDILICWDSCRSLLLPWNALQSSLDHFADDPKDFITKFEDGVRGCEVPRGPIKCPQCQKNMRRHSFSATTILIDECFYCHHFFIESCEVKKTKKNELSDWDSKLFQEELIYDVPDYIADSIISSVLNVRKEAAKKLIHLLDYILVVEHK